VPQPLKSNHLKEITGSRKPLTAPEVELPTPADVPQAPDWLKNAHAQAEWSRLAPLLHRTGLLTEGGLNAFAVLCAVHGTIVESYAAGGAPNGHTIAQYRGLVNDFGLTPGAQSKVKPGAADAPKNRFAKFGKRRP
jgi:phage terminase small subunit